MGIMSNCVYYCYCNNKCIQYTTIKRTVDADDLKKIVSENVLLITNVFS